MTFGVSRLRKSLRVLLGIFALLGFSFAVEAASLFAPGRILIIPNPDKAADITNLHRQKGRQVAKRFQAFKNLEVVNLPAGEDVVAAGEEDFESGFVGTAEPD